jgi:Cys-tRNA(Pro)/Cys-tRNA(Cys) deacylase
VEKTNAARLLDARGIAYRATVYDATRAFHSADEAAALLGAPPEAVYKTLVVLREPPAARAKPILVLVPSHRQLDLKRLARETGDKKLRMASQKEAEALTGLQVGGISALAVRAGAFEVLVDAGARERERIHVSAGVRGTPPPPPPADLVRVTGARFVPAAGPQAPGD